MIWARCMFISRGLATGSKCSEIAPAPGAPTSDRIVLVLGLIGIWNGIGRVGQPRPM